MKKNSNYDGKTLMEILKKSHKTITGLMNAKDPSFQIYQTISKIWGSDFSQKCCYENLTEEEKAFLPIIIKHLDAELNNKKSSFRYCVYQGMLAADILNTTSEDLMLAFSKKRKGTKSNKLLVAMFGPDLQKPYDNANLAKSDRTLFYSAMNQLEGNLLGLYSKRMEKYNYLTLKEILFAARNYYFEFVAEIKKDVSVYQVFIKYFGENLNKPFEYDPYAYRENGIIYKTVTAFKDRANLNEPDVTEILEPFDIVSASISLIEEKEIRIIKILKEASSYLCDEYRKVLELSLGTYNSKIYSIPAIAEILGLNEKEVRYRREKGLIILENVLKTRFKANREQKELLKRLKA